LTLPGYPTIKIYEDEELRFLMYEDYFYHSIERSREMSNNKLLEQLQIRFQQSDRTLTEFGLPNPQSINTELEREKLKYNSKEEWELFMLLNRTIVNNLEQQNVLNKIYSDIDKGKSKIYFLQGQAGSGKTTIAKKIIHYARSKNKIVLGCAATALAAQNYDGFDTFHGLFKYPVIEDMEDIDQIDCIELSMSNYPQRKELINAASVIIWDEAPSNEYHCFKTVYEYFDCFKGKIIICLGDWKQTPPVVKYGSVSDICKASIINSPIWSLFNVFKLTINMRLFGEINANKHNEEYIKKQKDYANMLINIGEGNCDNINVIHCKIFIL
jgi:tRNA A37 threonylcarbamoyladenosine biosynthesis protein TsaE